MCRRRPQGTGTSSTSTRPMRRSNTSRRTEHRGHQHGLAHPRGGSLMNVGAGARNVIISTVCLSGTLEDKLRAAAAAGFAGVEMLEYDLVMAPWSPRRVADEAADLGL